MSQYDKPHGVATSPVPRATSRIESTHLTVTRSLIRNGTTKMHLLNEALARARMRDLWRGEHRHKRLALRALRDAKRTRR
ncbi:hypothetical protein STSO111631_22575 [Stackebrandtia soli]